MAIEASNTDIHRKTVLSDDSVSKCVTYSDGKAEEEVLSRSDCASETEGLSRRRLGAAKKWPQAQAGCRAGCLQRQINRPSCLTQIMRFMNEAKSRSRRESRVSPFSPF